MNVKLPPVLDEAWLWALDRERLDRPRKVVALLGLAIPEIDEGLLALLYAVCGAAYRQLERLGDARWAYQLAEEYAEGDPVLIALITQRRAWIDAANGRLPKAIDQLRCAAGIFTELGDRNSLGRTLVDRGVLFAHSKSLEQSSACMIEALSYLDINDFDYRFAAYNTCAVNDRTRGNHSGALAWMAQAIPLLPMCAEQAGEKLLWMRAECLVGAGEYLVAAAAYLEISATCRKGENFIDGALAAAQAARAFLAGGDLGAAAEAGKTLSWFAFHITSEVAQAAQAALIEASEAAQAAQAKRASAGRLASGLRAATQALSQLRK